MPVFDLWTALVVVAVTVAGYKLTAQWLQHRHDRTLARLEQDHELAREVHQDTTDDDD